MDPHTQKAADANFEAALAQSGGRDPREFYRERLRELKDANPASYQEAVAFYTNELVPAVAAGSVDPLAAWLDYGVRLCEWCAPGEPVEIDPTGVRNPLSASTPPDRLVLHIPGEKRTRALLVGLPAELTPAQRATFDLLVQGRLKLRPTSE